MKVSAAVAVQHDGRGPRHQKVRPSQHERRPVRPRTRMAAKLPMPQDGNRIVLPTGRRISAPAVEARTRSQTALRALHSRRRMPNLRIRKIRATRYMGRTLCHRTPLEKLTAEPHCDEASLPSAIARRHRDQHGAVRVSSFRSRPGRDRQPHAIEVDTCRLRRAEARGACGRASDGDSGIRSRPDLALARSSTPPTATHRRLPGPARITLIDVTCRRHACPRSSSTP